MVPGTGVELLGYSFPNPPTGYWRRRNMIFCTDPPSRRARNGGKSDLEQGTLRTRVWGLSGPGYHTDQVDIRLAACITGGSPCQTTGWAAGYAETVESFISCLVLLSRRAAEARVNRSHWKGTLFTCHSESWLQGKRNVARKNRCQQSKISPAHIVYTSTAMTVMNQSMYMSKERSRSANFG